MKEKKEENENNSSEDEIIENDDNDGFEEVKGQENYDDESEDKISSNIKKKNKNKMGDFYWNYQIRDKKKQSINLYLWFLSIIFYIKFYLFIILVYDELKNLFEQDKQIIKDMNFKKRKFDEDN